MRTSADSKRSVTRIMHARISQDSTSGLLDGPGRLKRQVGPALPERLAGGVDYRRVSAANEYRDLGMTRRIPRRDFLNGIAVGVTGAYACARAPSLAALAA